MRHVFLLFAFTVAALFAVAQSGGQRSYNYQRALEAVENEDYNEAMRYFQKAVEENPKDGYSYMWNSYDRVFIADYQLYAEI